MNGKRSTEIYERLGTEEEISKRSSEQNLFNCGYLFLEKIYYELGLNNICNDISERYSFKYDLNNILSRLIYSLLLN